MRLKSIYTMVFAASVLSGWVSCIDDPAFGSGVRNAGKPEVSKPEIIDKDKTASSIVLKSAVLKANGYPVTERGFVWNTDSVRPVDDPDQLVQAGEGIGEYTDTIKNLSPDVLYYFWSYAKNEVGTVYSEFDSASTTSGLGSIKTYLIEEEYTYATHATISGKITLQGEGKTIVRGAYYSTSTAFENKITVESKTPFEQDSFVCQLSGLSPLTSYWAQSFATNEVSGKQITTLGEKVAFKTGDGMPVVGDIVRLITDYSAVYVEAWIFHQGDTVMEERGFCWGTTSDPRIEIDSVVPLGYQPGAIVAQIGELVPEQQYFIRAYATNKYGTAYGKVQDFYVKNDKPTVQTQEPSYDYDAGTVFMKGLIYDKGKSDIINRGVCYSSTVAVPTITDGTPVEIPATGDEFSQHISGLKGGTKYYIRAYASNSEGISYGGVQEITTPNALMADSDVFPGSVRLTGSSAYFAMGDKGYLLGGDKGAAYTDELWSYNGTAGGWQPLLPHPEGAAKWQSVAVKGNMAYVLGGLSVGNVLVDDFRRYNSSNNIWGEPLPSGPDPAYSRMGVTLDDAAYFIGGMGDTVKNEVWSYHITPNVWEQKADFPVKQYGGIALTLDNEIYAGMGKDGVDMCNKTIWKLNSDLSTWTQETDHALIAGGVLAGAVYNRKIYLIDESYYIHEYELSSKTWTRKIQINAGGQDVHGMFVINDKIYIGLIGNKMYKYNPLWDN